MDMYERYCKLRDQLGVRDADVARGAGVSKTTFSDWKNGRSQPKGEKLSKIAGYFNVSVDYLMTGEKKEGDEEHYYLNEETREMAQQIFENKELRTLFDAAADASPDDLKITHDMLLALKRKERGEVD